MRVALLLAAMIVGLFVVGLVVGLGAAGRRCPLVRERQSGPLVICTYDCPAGVAEMTFRRVRCPRVIEEPER